MTREEAINAVKNNLPDSSYARLQEALETLIPELKESEDERIRKAIHIYLDWLDGRKDYAPKGEYSIRDMIAWLEKKGEQKPAEKIEPKFKIGDAYDICPESLWALKREMNKVGQW